MATRHSDAFRRYTDEYLNPETLVIEASGEPLPPNPPVREGVAVRWLGPQRQRLEGEASGYVYHADATRRVIRVDQRDLPAVLRTRGFELVG